jgi:hypothetical protein
LLGVSGGDKQKGNPRNENQTADATEKLPIAHGTHQVMMRKRAPKTSTALLAAAADRDTSAEADQFKTVRVD